MAKKRQKSEKKLERVGTVKSSANDNFINADDDEEKDLAAANDQAPGLFFGCSRDKINECVVFSKTPFSKVIRIRNCEKHTFLVAVKYYD